MNKKIQEIIDNAAKKLKETLPVSDSNQTTAAPTESKVSRIRDHLSNWTQNINETINSNLRDDNSPPDIIVRHSERNRDEYNPQFIEQRLQEINAENKILSDELIKSRDFLNQNLTNVKTDVFESKDKIETASEDEKEQKVVQNMEGVKLLTRQKVRVLEEQLLTKVFGQDDVISNIVTTLKSAALNIKINKEKPAGCYLFAGPSGVGKTELAVSISEKLDVPILKINMGEYSLETDITKLIGTSKGYVGYKEGGLLTNFVRDNPACIILFDELEKAHPSIDKPLLSIMDHGICTDNMGQDISFKETIVIATSNLGAEVEYYGEMSKEDKDRYRMEAIKEGLRPEIINRYDSVFHFNALSPEIYGMVSQKFLKKLQENMQEEHNYKLNFSQKLIDFIIEKSYDPAMGGRPARRFIEQVVLQPLIEKMLDDDFEEIVELHPVITMDLNKDNNICFKGTKQKILGTQKNTAEIVARIEQGKFTQKKEVDFSEDAGEVVEPVSVRKKSLGM